MAGCRGDGVPYSQLHERQQHLCRGMGVPYGSPNNTTLEPAHCHIPLCVGAAGPVLRYTLDRYGAPRVLINCW